VDIARVLLRDNPNLISSSICGETLLVIALSCGSTKVAKLLIASGAEVNARSIGGVTPLHKVSCLSSAPSCVELTKLLLVSGAEVNTRSVGGITPLHCAAARCNYEVAKLLLASGAEVNAKDEEGTTAFTVARQKYYWAEVGFGAGYEAVAELLRQHGGTGPRNPPW
jgi:ankyrin repeat protein